jgi:hypothetical protein
MGTGAEGVTNKHRGVIQTSAHGYEQVHMGMNKCRGYEQEPRRGRGTNECRCVLG